MTTHDDSRLSEETTGRLAWLGAGAVIAAAAWWAYRRASRYDFHGRTVLLMGASRGLGLLMAREFLQRGARVVLTARDDDELETARQRLAACGSVQTFVCDVTVRNDVESVIARVEQTSGPVDVLVNNAGIITIGPVRSMTEDDFERAMGVHFRGPLYATLAVVPGMVERGDGRIVNIASMGGKVAVPHSAPYSASKFALVGLSEALRAELAQDGIRVTWVCPQPMRTGSALAAEFKGQAEDEFTWFATLASLPVLSADAERAAKRIVDAVARGEAEVVIGPLARLARFFHGLAPNLTARSLQMMNALLPRRGRDQRAMRGAEAGRRHELPWLGSTERAADAYGEPG